MLYKKIHRQHLRQFWKGRKFKFKTGKEIYRVSRKPYIIDEDHTIYVDYGDYDFLGIISMTSRKVRYIDKIIWLED